MCQLQQLTEHEKEYITTSLQPVALTRGKRIKTKYMALAIIAGVGLPLGLEENPLGIFVLIHKLYLFLYYKSERITNSNKRLMNKLRMKYAKIRIGASII